MTRLLVCMVVGFGASCLSSCFLVSIPVKATGELIEKSAQATGRAMNRGIHNTTRPARSTRASADDWDDSGSDDYSEGDLEHLPPLLPRR